VMEVIDGQQTAHNALHYAFCFQSHYWKDKPNISDQKLKVCHTAFNYLKTIISPQVISLKLFIDQEWNEAWHYS
jgi:hypothetical protein